MSPLVGLMVVEVNYYLIIHSLLLLKPSAAREPFMSRIFYAFKSMLTCVMCFYTDENINNVNCVCCCTGRTCGELIHVQRAGQCNADDAVHECGFTVTLLIIHGGHVREKK